MNPAYIKFIEDTKVSCKTKKAIKRFLIENTHNDGAVFQNFEANEAACLLDIICEEIRFGLGSELDENAMILEDKYREKIKAKIEELKSLIHEADYSIGD